MSDLNYNILKMYVTIVEHWYNKVNREGRIHPQNGIYNVDIYNVLDVCHNIKNGIRRTITLVPSSICYIYQIYISV